VSPLSRNAFKSLLVAVMASALFAIAAITSAGAAEPTGPEGDHLVVSQIPVVSTAQGVTLVRFNGAGASDGASWPLPTTTSGANNRFTLGGESNAVGALARSADGKYVTLAGTTAAVGGNAEGTDARVVARVNGAGTVDTSTTLGKTFGGSKVRGAVTNDGNQFWVTGNGNTEGSTPLGGMVYQPLGSTGTPTVIVSREVPSSSSNKALNNFRSVQIAGGNLYSGSEKGTAGVYQVAGLPTKATAPTAVTTFSGEIDPISELPLEHEPGSGKVDLMYVVKESDGIYKYSLSGSTWTERGRLVSGTFSGVTGKVDSEGHFRLYAISGSSAANSVVTITDTAAFNAAPATTGTKVVSTAPAGNAYRGIAFAPEVEGTVPGAPTAVGATAGDTKATVSWTAPSDQGSSSITAYKITPIKNGVAQSSITTPSAGTTYTVEGLTNGSTYTFTVAAVNATGAGPASEPSAVVIPSAPGAPLPVISLSDEYLEGTNGDPTNPTVQVTVEQAGTPASELAVEATATSKASVAAVSGVTVTGNGATRTVSVTPTGGVGYADITLRVTGAEGKSTVITLHYAASAAGSNPATTRYHTGAADGSTAIDVGNGYMLIGDDENNVLRLYRDSVSGPPVKEWNFNAQMGNPEEIDIEASARVGNTIYWTGSMGNSKKGNLKPYRSTLFSTHISGEGASTELTFGGYYKGLRADLIAWDEANGNRFGFAAGAAAGNIPKQINGFNVEGMEFAPGSSETAYVGFRAPLSPAKTGGKALIVPVTNLAALATSGQNTTLHATFGEPILMDLEGLSIREIRKNAAGEYLIIAGSWAGSGPQALYTWDGKPADPPVKALTSIGSAGGEGDDGGAWEGIGALPNALTTGEEVTLVMDVGAANLYGDGTEAKELIPEFQKSPSNSFTLELPVVNVAPESTSAPTLGGKALVGSTLTCVNGEWTGTPAPTFAYEWQRGGEAIPGAAAAEYTAVAADGGRQVRCVVTATNAAGSASASSAAVTVQAAPQNLAAPTVAGVPHVGGTLSCSAGEWSGSPEPTFAYEWQRDGMAIVGAGASTYDEVAADGGHQVRCVVTATNAVGSASAASAAVTVQPATCTGGPASGQGSTMQDAAQNDLWIPGYEATCGSGHEISYTATGSAAGLSAWGFNGASFQNSAAFIATEDAPTAAQIKAGDAASGTHALVIPVAQTAIAVVVNPPAGCEVEEITNKQLENVMSGKVKIWNKVLTASGAGCVNAPITRVVRAESSGTTYQLKAYLAQIDAGALACTEGGKTWKQLEPLGAGASPNTAWPESGVAGCAANAVSPILTAAGGGAVVAKVDANAGAIGYAALPEVEAGKTGDTKWLKLQNNGVSNKLAIAQTVSPLEEIGDTAQCGSAVYGVPKTAKTTVANPADSDWSGVVGSNPNVAGASGNTDAYPLCMLTYEIALTQYSKAGFTEDTELSVKDYLANWVTANVGQEALEAGKRFYAPLPGTVSPASDVLGAARLAAGKIGF
jgi:hypothetical protein